MQAQKQVITDLTVLTGFVADDCKVMRENAAVLQTWAQDLVDAFYNTLYGHGSTAKVFQEGERPHREKTFSDWYLEITSGEIDDDFWQRQWFVGLVHVKRQVDNQFVVGIMGRIQKIFLEKCMTVFEPAKAEQVFSAFKHITDVIAGLIVEGYKQQYLSAVERTSGISPALIERMATNEAAAMLDEARAKK